MTMKTFSVVAWLGSAAAVNTPYQDDIFGGTFFADNRDNQMYYDRFCIASNGQGNCDVGYTGANCNSCDTINGYILTAASPSAEGINECIPVKCDAKIHCNSEWNEYGTQTTGPIHTCANANTDATCTCSGDVTGTKCDECKPTFTNWPWCDVTVADPLVTAVASSSSGCAGHGKLNTKYVGGTAVQVQDLASKAKVVAKMSELGFTECGLAWCTNSETCYSWAAYEGLIDPTDGTYAAPKIPAHMKCIRKGFVGCGAGGECDPGEICLDPVAGTCTTDYGVKHVGRTPCLPYLATLNNGTMVAGTVAALIGFSVEIQYCEPWETCCDGICCNDGGRFGQGRQQEGVCTDRATQNEFTSGYGYDLRWSLAGMFGAGQFAHMARKYCDPFTMNALHGFRIVLIPLLLTFAYVLAIAKTVNLKSPSLVKYVGLVMLVICIFSAYHYEWQRGAFLALVVVYTLFGTSPASKPSFTPLFVLFLQLILFAMLFRVAILDFFVQSYFENFDNLADRNTFERCVETYSYFKSHHYSLAHDEEVTWMFLDPSDRLLGYGMRVDEMHRVDPNPGGTEYVPMELYHGFCSVGWIAVMDFFYAVQAFLLLALMIGTAETFFDQNNKVSPQEVQVP